MRPKLLALLFPLCFAAGCAMSPSRPVHFDRPAGLSAEDAFVTQRAVLTVHGRQFTLNGYLAQDKTRGKRLIVTETFGRVMADVLVTPDGTIHLMRPDAALKPDWIKRYVAADLECIFGGTAPADCPVEMPDAKRFLVKRPAYSLDLRILETKPGPQAAELFDATRAAKP